MYVHYALMKARQEELLRTATRGRRAAEARPSPRLRRQRTMPAPSRRLPSLRLRGGACAEGSSACALSGVVMPSVVGWHGVPC